MYPIGIAITLLMAAMSPTDEIASLNILCAGLFVLCWAPDLMGEAEEAVLSENQLQPGYSVATYVGLTRAQGKS